MAEAAHLPMREVVRRAGALPGVRPRRFVPLLLPMWAVDVVAEVREAHSYDVFDRYLSRAVAEAGLRRPAELAAFFGVEPALVTRAVRFLVRIGHLRYDGDDLALTELGHLSIADGRRHVLTPGRRITLRFDGCGGEPVPHAHATHSVWLSEPALTLPDGTVFDPVGPAHPLPPNAVELLLNRPDTADFTGPAVPVQVTAAAPRPVWLPIYAVECEDEPLVFGWAVDGPDPYLRDVYDRHRGQSEAD